MRRINKSSEDNELTEFLKANPTGDWNDFRNYDSGKSYKATKLKLFQEQYELCAYCEISIPLTKVTENNRRIEHFFSKSANHLVDKNIVLDWFNLLGVCIGGSDVESKEDYELPANLSCDAHKEHVESQEASGGKDWTGLVLFPIELPNGSDFFIFDKATGNLLPNSELCNRIDIKSNKYQTTEELVLETIRVFNLNCDRLNTARRKVLHEFERQMKRLRKADNRQMISAFVSHWQSIPSKSFQTTRDLLIKGNKVTASFL